MYRVALIATAFSVLFVATSVDADERTETQRWAIVSARDLQGGGLVDLLTAKLSQDESLQLVERADVARVLDELSLQASGLVDPKQAVKFGKILSADAILVIEKAADDDEAWLHARLVETKSGIRLWSGLAPQADEDDDDMCDVIVKQLRSASRKMETDGKRRYVGILDIKSEDLNGSSDIFTATIRLMLEHDLQQSLQLVVLEREQALRLLEERDLTGIDLELRGATTLIEGGVRRVAASGDREVSLRFISTATGVAKSISVAIPADDWGLARCKLRRECLEAMVTSPEMEAAAPGPDETTHEDEATLFRIRSEWRSSHRQKEEAAALAEVAFALEPSLANCDRLTACYGTVAVDHRRDTLERLQAALRYHQVAHLFLRQGVRNDSTENAYWYRLIFGCDYKPGMMEPGERRVFEETRRLRGATFERELAVRRASGGVVMWFFANRMAKAHYMTDSASEFVADVRSLMSEVDRETAAGRFERTMAGGYFQILYGSLQEQIELAVKEIPNPTMRHYGLVAIPGDWGPQGIQPLLDWLVQHEEPRFQMLGHYGLCTLDGEAGVSAAHTVLDMWLDVLTDEDARGRYAYSPQIDAAIKRLRAEGRFADYVDQRIQAVERSGDVARFCKWNSLPAMCMLNRHPQKTVEWCERFLRIVDQYEPGDRTLGGRARELARLLKLNLDRYHQRGDFVPKTDAGWGGYNVWRLPVRGQTKLMNYLSHVAVDQDPSSDHPIVAAWRCLGSPGSRVIVNRLGRRGGDLVEVGRIGRPRFIPTCMTVGGDDVFLGDSQLGIAQVGPDGVRYFGEQQGLPQAKVEALAWLDPYLYAGYAGAIGRVDPQSGEFRLLATSRAVEPRSPLDGGRNYEVRSLLSDRANDCVWICVYEPAMGPNRSGIWKYTPDTGGFRHLHKDVVRHIARADEGLLCLSPKPGTTHDMWRIFHTDTEQCRTLDGIGWFIGSGIRQPPGWGYLDGGVIGSNGSIYTADGKSYRHRDGGWKQPVDRLGRGLVAVSFERRAFWYIEPKGD